MEKATTQGLGGIKWLQRKFAEEYISSFKKKPDATACLCVRSLSNWWAALALQKGLEGSCQKPMAVNCKLLQASGGFSSHCLLHRLLCELPLSLPGRTHSPSSCSNFHCWLLGVRCIMHFVVLTFVVTLILPSLQLTTRPRFYMEPCSNIKRLLGSALHYIFRKAVLITYPIKTNKGVY